LLLPRTSQAMAYSPRMANLCGLAVLGERAFALSPQDGIRTPRAGIRSPVSETQRSENRLSVQPDQRPAIEYEYRSAEYEYEECIVVGSVSQEYRARTTGVFPFLVHCRDPSRGGAAVARPCRR